MRLIRHYRQVRRISQYLERLKSQMVIFARVRHRTLRTDDRLCVPGHKPAPTLPLVHQPVRAARRAQWRRGWLPRLGRQRRYSRLDEVAIHLPAFWLITTHHRARNRRQALQPGARGKGAQAQASVQLPAHICTMCLMSGMNPAFIAGQLGHSVQVLLSTYAKWLNSANDWAELAKLEKNVMGTASAQD